METMARRTFLFGAFSKENAPVKPDICNESLQGMQKNPLLKIGKVRDFPLGKEKPTQDGSLIIESLPEGLRARSSIEKNQYFAINANQYAELIVNRQEVWPANRVYSIMTGEAQDLNTSWEEET
jgi:hypothetical protein